MLSRNGPAPGHQTADPIQQGARTTRGSAALSRLAMAARRLTSAGPVGPAMPSRPGKMSPQGGGRLPALASQKPPGRQTIAAACGVSPFNVTSRMAGRGAAAAIAAISAMSPFCRLTNGRASAGGLSRTSWSNSPDRPAPRIGAGTSRHHHHAGRRRHEDIPGQIPTDEATPSHERPPLRRTPRHLAQRCCGEASTRCQAPAPAAPANVRSFGPILEPMAPPPARPGLVAALR